MEIENKPPLCTGFPEVNAMSFGGSRKGRCHEVTEGLVIQGKTIPHRLRRDTSCQPFCLLRRHFPTLWGITHVRGSRELVLNLNSPLNPNLAHLVCTHSVGAAIGSPLQKPTNFY